MRRALAMAGALALAGCTGIDTSSGRPYPCSPDGGNGNNGSADPQCPSGWRCGLEGRCHQRGVAGPYQCISDLQCEQGWRCSSSGVCVDASQDGLISGADASYSVRRLNPLWLSDRPELFAQAETYQSTYIFDGTFYNLTVTASERSFSFIADGGLLHGLVVQTDAGTWQALPIESSRLRLQPYVALAEGPSTAFALATDGTTDVFIYDAGSLTVPWPGFPADALRIEAGSDQAFFAPVTTTGAATGLLLAFGGNQYALATGQTFDCEPGGAQRLSAENGLAPVITPGCIPAPDGGCEGIEDMAVLDPAPATSYAIPDDFFWANFEQTNGLAPFWQTPYEVLGFDRSLMAATDDGLFMALGAPQCPSSGLFAFDDGTPGAPTPHWQPVDTLDIPNGACPQTATPSGPQYFVRRLHGMSEQNPGTWMLAEEVPVGTDPKDNSNVSIALLSIGNPNQAIQGSTPPSGPLNCTSTVPIADYVVCSACPAQSQFLGAQLSSYAVPLTTLFPGNPAAVDAGVLVPYPIAEVRCGLTASDGTALVDVFQFDFGSVYSAGIAVCQPVFVNQAAAGQAVDLTLEDKSTSGNPSFAGDFGQLWLEGGLMTNASPLTLNASPLAVFGSGNALTLTFGSGDIWITDPVLGFTAAPASEASTVLGSVKNRPEWVVQSNGLVTDTSHQSRRGAVVVAALDPTADAFRAPLSAILLSLPGGKSQLVISSFDILLGADMTGVVNTLNGVDAGTLTGVEVIPALVSARAVPIAKSPISSMIVAPQASGTFGGYALTANGLAQFDAVTEQHWDTSTVAIPTGDWIAVVDEAGRARIGYGDGSIYGLPSRVLLAAPFLDGTRVSDYASLCGETLALSSSGVFRLTAGSGGGSGYWAPLDLSEAAIRGVPLSGLGGGHLYAPGAELDVLGSLGTVSQITCR